MKKFEFEVEDISQISDGYHTFEELYFHRWKSRLHDDGTMFNNYFIIEINTPIGQIHQLDNIHIITIWNTGDILEK